MFRIYKDGKAGTCHDSELKRMERQGWNVQEPKLESEDTTILYKRLEGELVEGHEREPDQEVIVHEDIFANADVDQAIECGWYKDIDDATNAPPDKAKEPAASGAVTIEA